MPTHFHPIYYRIPVRPTFFLLPIYNCCYTIIVYPLAFQPQSFPPYYTLLFCTFFSYYWCINTFSMASIKTSQTYSQLPVLVLSFTYFLYKNNSRKINSIASIQTAHVTPPSMCSFNSVMILMKVAQSQSLSCVPVLAGRSMTRQNSRYVRTHSSRRCSRLYVPFPYFLT